VKVGDIMTRDVITARRETTVEEIARLLWSYRISGLPVVDEQRKVVGIVTESDLLARNAHLHVPTYLRVLDALIPLGNPRRFEEEMRRALGTTAGEVMTEDVIAISSDTELVDAATLMMDRRVNRLPVVDEGRLAGIISRSDFVRLLAQDQAP
jgi:CBS domain-containing protein